MHIVANLATLQTPLATFIPFKKEPKPYLVSENRRYWRVSARSCSTSASTHLSLSLSLCVCLVSLPARAHTSLSLSLSLSLSASASASAQFLSQRAHTPLSLSASAQYLFSKRRRGAALSVKHRYYVASLILQASTAEITAQLLSLSYVYLISSDDSAIIMIFFVQINILEGRAFLCSLNGSRFNHYFIFIPLSDNRNHKIY